MKYNKINIIDLECTCWEDDSDYQVHNSEIIEIGLCELNLKTREINNCRTIYVRSRCFEEELKGKKFPRPVISDYCTQLTGISHKILLKQGKSLSDAIAEIEKHYARSKIWMSWGNFDKKMITIECLANKLLFPFSNEKHINAKALFGLKFALNKGFGLDKALSELKLSFEGNKHCGKDDAYNTARVISKVLE